MRTMRLLFLDTLGFPQKRPRPSAPFTNCRYSPLSLPSLRKTQVSASFAFRTSAHEVSSAGLWPGDISNPPMFYSYAVPEPHGFRDAHVPRGAAYSEQLGEFVLPYEAVRASADPEATLLAFLRST